MTADHTQPPRHACAEPLDVWLDENVLLSFDGRVLEFFESSDARRIHIARGPHIEFGENPASPKKRPRLTIRAARHSYTTWYAPSSRAGLEQLDATLREATACYASHNYAPAPVSGAR